MNNPWFRVYTELLSDRKIARAAARAGISKCEMIGAWIGLLCLANESPVRGSLYVTLHERFSNADVTTELALHETTWEKVRFELTNMGMIEEIDGAICIKNWNKRQYISDNSTERVQKHREKQTRNVSVTPAKRFSNAPDTDTESERTIAPKNGARETLQPAQRLEKEEMDKLVIKNPGAMAALKKFQAKQERGEADLAQIEEYLWPLAKAFVDGSGIQPVKMDAKYWNKVLNEQWERGIKPEFITKAIKKMRNDGLSIKSPASVTAIANDLQAKAIDKAEEYLGEEYT